MLAAMRPAEVTVSSARLAHSAILVTLSAHLLKWPKQLQGPLSLPPRRLQDAASPFCRVCC